MGCSRVLFLRALLLLLLCAPLLGPSLLANPPGARAQDMPSLGDAPVFTEDLVVIPAEDFGPAATGLVVNTANREETRAFFNQYYADAPQPDIQWTGNVETCNAGTTSAAFKDAVLLRINFYRAMAGVPAGATLLSTASAKNQQSALITSANGALSHFPDESWECWSEDGEEAAGSSNLFIGVFGWDAVDGYIHDYGEHNGAVGHRRWLLHPQTQTFGTGDIPGPWEVRTPANSIWVFDDNMFGPRPATRDNFVAWPPQGYVPYQVVFPRWSFSYPDADFSGATVTMSLEGDPIPVVVDSRTDNGYGENTIVWRPNNMDSRDAWPQPENDTTYTVTVSNVEINGQSQSFTYDVTVFDPTTSGGSASLAPTRGIPRSWVDTSVSGFAADTPVQVRWEDDTLLTTLTTDDNGAATGRFRVPYTEMGTYPVRFVGGGDTITKQYEVVPRIKLTPGEGAPGDSIDVSLRGFVARETVRIRWQRGSSWEEIARVITSNTGSANIDVQVPSWAPEGLAKVRGDSTSGGAAAQTNAFTVVSRDAGSLELSANYGTVNLRLTATVSAFPPNTDVTVTFPGFYEVSDTATTDAAGEATLILRAPATPFGDYTVVAVGGGTEASAAYEVAPRIKLIPGEGAPGDLIDVSLRGFEAREVIRIRWEGDDGFEEIGRVTTSSSGSANIDLPVPSWVVDGAQSVRGDEVTPGVGGRAQTNAFVVTGAEFTDASAASAPSTRTPVAWTPFVDDFETGTLERWTETTGVEVQAGDPRSGAFVARAASQGEPASARVALSAPQSDLYVRTAFKPIAQGANPVRLVQLGDVADAPLLDVSLDAESRLVVTNQLTGRQATGPAVAAGAWHELQLHVRVGAADGVVEVWLDGKRVAELIGADMLGSDPIAHLVIGDDARGRSYDMFFDDVGVDLHCFGACALTGEAEETPTPETATPEPSPTVAPTEEPVTPEPTEDPAPPTVAPTSTPEPEPTATEEPTEEAIPEDQQLSEEDSA